MHKNIYGHDKRVDIVTSLASRQSAIAEFGCGTGLMITQNLVHMGYNCTGFDIDQASIAYGKEYFISQGISEDKLSNKDFFASTEKYDLIIASEVFEHIQRSELKEICSGLKKKLKKDGLLVVTVPNGYGCFELENFVWKKLSVGVLFEKLRIMNGIIKLKKTLNISDHDELPSSLSSSPHVQRFTLKSIILLLEESHFSIQSYCGTAFLSGPISNLFFTGFKRIMSLNKKIGDIAPSIASGFIIVAKNKE